MKKYLLNINEMDKMIEEIADDFKNGVVVLRGDLAAGKTTFVKKMAQHLGIKEDVTSPTFSLQHCYGDRVFHYDMYNHGLEHFISLGMLEELEKEGLHFVEWGDDTLVKVLNSAGIDTLTVDIKKISNDKREYIVCTR